MVFSKPQYPEENRARYYGAGNAMPPEQWPVEWRAYINSMPSITDIYGRPETDPHYGTRYPTYTNEEGYALERPKGPRMTELVLYGVGVLALVTVGALLIGQVRRRELF